KILTRTSAATSAHIVEKLQNVCPTCGGRFRAAPHSTRRSRRPEQIWALQISKRKKTDHYFSAPQELTLQHGKGSSAGNEVRTLHLKKANGLRWCPATAASLQFGNLRPA